MRQRALGGAEFWLWLSNPPCRLPRRAENSAWVEWPNWMNRPILLKTRRKIPQEGGVTRVDPLVCDDAVSYTHLTLPTKA